MRLHPLADSLAEAAEADPGGEACPGLVEDDVRAYLRCGILADGFARVRCGACAAERLHRFGAALNPHFHFHLVVLDGLFTEQSDGTVRFDEATRLRADDAHALQRPVQRRVLGLFQCRGLLEPHTVADMLGWQAAGGFSLDASVRGPRSGCAQRARHRHSSRQSGVPPPAGSTCRGSGTLPPRWI